MNIVDFDSAYTRMINLRYAALSTVLYLSLFFLSFSLSHYSDVTTRLEYSFRTADNGRPCLLANSNRETRKIESLTETIIRITEFRPSYPRDKFCMIIVNKLCSR